MEIRIDPFRCVSLFCCLFWLVTTCVFAGVFGWSYSGWVSGTPFSYEEACKLMYSEDGVITEKEMKRWAGMEGWKLTHPRYDLSKKACVCSSDTDPSSPSGETPVWIAPGDLVSLYRESLPSQFVDTYSEDYSSLDHVRVCAKQEVILSLWNSDHCHSESQGILTTIFTGWDGSLFCEKTCPPSPSVSCFQNSTCGADFSSSFDGYSKVSIDSTILKVEFSNSLYWHKCKNEWTRCKNNGKQKYLCPS